jgi:hypothetical protein
MASKWTFRVAASLAASALVMGGVIASSIGSASAEEPGSSGPSPVLFVSPTGLPANSDHSCGSAKYAKIQSAVSAAPSGARVVVCQGVYHEQVVVQKALVLEGRNATIDEAGVTPTFVVPPPVGPLNIFAGVVITSSHVSFSGFTVQHALGEGVLAATIQPRAPVHDVQIRFNRVVHNDLGGGVPPASTYFECQANGQIPGDCGEGVHFIGVADSTIGHNRVSDNSGGILLTDETGPTHDNLIVGNDVTNNQSDCGITVPGHNPDALNAAGKRQPSVAGVYRNAIIGNAITNNGHLGEGAGVLFANASAGTASYDNLVQGNYIAGNQLAGVTMHAHLIAPGDPNKAKGEDLNGNRVSANFIGQNMVPGQFVNGDDLDGVTTVKDTTGVLVWAGPVKVHVTIAGNFISNNVNGIWVGKTSNVVAQVSPVTQLANVNFFDNVGTPVVTFP